MVYIVGANSLLEKRPVLKLIVDVHGPSKVMASNSKVSSHDTNSRFQPLASIQVSFPWNGSIY